MRAQRVLGVVLAASIAAAWVGCGDSDTSETPTTAASSSGGGGSTTATTTVTTTSVTTTSVSTTTGNPSSNLGTECVADSDCGTGGKCLKAGDDDPVLGGGPASGYCSADCESDSDCDGGTCIKAGEVGECFLDCAIGPELEFLDDPLDSDKCHGREDLRCTPVTGGGEVCYPSCGSDEQCGAGKICDPRLTVCLDPGDVSTGLPYGSACDPMATTPDCAGTCVNFSGGTTMCSTSCVLGGEIDLYDCGGLTNGLCVFSPADNGAGDYGFCSQACNEQSDCNNPTWWCFGIGGISGGLVDNGYCFGATECPNGQSDCDAASGDTCTDTKHGPFCLDATYPLGSAGTGSGGGGGGAGGGGSGGGAGVGGAGQGGGGVGGAGVGGAGVGGAGVGGLGVGGS